MRCEKTECPAPIRGDAGHLFHQVNGIDRARRWVGPLSPAITRALDASSAFAQHLARRDDDFDASPAVLAVDVTLHRGPLHRLVPAGVAEMHRG
jgi:hypothetical protein